ncbi:hypothetical protein A2304_00885 [Candidatus Uhrbacteria bacterium RIFOXYB2_FULL_57_15]|uniref:SIMPL domain-containing protein n=1 Tax=Candidatus Uhrbacteria bacterium RIFOXYB2_FULL_57_15 TaxID=1802422 RepID=A0A1F7W5L8_9BACT|nr:MAG: hypothetical protein A2304_00885 [Candidatus Uhrbacteria bacterium RIFOXYB2_FULL_57_15]OGL99729.1 MAG: hypothetical protein A2501_00220 [Candidatus Uhrbacteria bacterium RIFOXYC12_FULL_57_11]
MTVKKQESNPTPASISIWPAWHENKPFALTLLLTFAFLIAFLMARTSLALGEASQVGKPDPYEHQISIDGTATVTGVPDIATVTLGVESKGADVATAQSTNSESTNALIASVVALGVDKSDVQTSNYSAYENTEWNPDTETYDSAGWIVSQQVTVKVRDTSRLSTVLDVAGRNGATSISGPNFTIDDTSHLRDQAREEAIADATEKAAVLAASLGVRLERVVGYSEWADSSYPSPYYALAEMGIGGSKPDVYAGTNEVTLNVSITYKLTE